MDNRKTFLAPCRGGLNLNRDFITLGTENPGAAIRLINYEPSLEGGYRRISGFSYLDNTYTAPSGTGPVLGVCVHDGIGIIAARKPSSGSNYIYKYTAGVGWTAINGHTPTFTGVDKVRFVKYNWTTPVIVVLDGVNRAQKWDGTTWTTINASGSATKPKYGAEFKNRLWVTNGDSILISSVPLAETDYTAGSGAFTVNVGFPIVGLKAFRDSLFIFGEDQIKQLTGNTSADFVVKPVTANIGCIAPDSIVEIGGDVYFLGPDGIRPIGGTDRIGDVELETISRDIQPLIQSIRRNYDLARVSAVAVRGKSQFRYFYYDGTISTADSEGLICALRKNDGGLSWEFSQLLGLNVYSCDSGYIDGVEYIVHGDGNGYVYRQEQGTTFNGGAIISVYQSPWLHFDDPMIRKTLYKLWTFVKNEGLSTINLGVRYDWSDGTAYNPSNYSNTYAGTAAIYGESEYDSTAVYDGVEAPVVRTNIEGSGYSASIRIVTLGTNPSHSIQGFTIEYGLGDRR